MDLNQWQKRVGWHAFGIKKGDKPDEQSAEVDGWLLQPFPIINNKISTS